jgi:hypothetical protein
MSIKYTSMRYTPMRCTPVRLNRLPNHLPDISVNYPIGRVVRLIRLLDFMRIFDFPNPKRFGGKPSRFPPPRFILHP